MTTRFAQVLLASAVVAALSGCGPADEATNPFDTGSDSAAGSATAGGVPTNRITLNSAKTGFASAVENGVMTFVSLVRLEGDTVVQYGSGVGTPVLATDLAEDYWDLALGETRVSTSVINVSGVGGISLDTEQTYVGRQSVTGLSQEMMSATINGVAVTP